MDIVELDVDIRFCGVERCTKTGGQVTQCAPKCLSIRRGAAFLLSNAFGYHQASTALEQGTIEELPSDNIINVLLDARRGLLPTIQA